MLFRSAYNSGQQSQKRYLKGENGMALVDIIKYEGDNSTFVWKHPCEDFNSLTQLVVHESQEAVFFMNGQALDLFGAGRYTLETQNIPKLGKLLNRTTGDNTPFHCEVYFINKTVQMAMKWGTDSKVRYIDPDSGVPLELGASGSLNMQVADSRKLLIKLVYRECNSSSYQLIKAFLGPIRAGFYQAFAWTFGASLTKKYDPEGEDRETERVVRLVESGQI